MSQVPEFWSFHLPFPPSVNQMYAGKERRFKTSKAKNYDKQMHELYKANYLEWNTCSVYFKENIQPDVCMIKIDRYFFVPRSRLYVKDPKSKDSVQKWDHTNNIKPLDDAIAKLIDIDDRYFFDGKAEKLESDDETSHVAICLSLCTPRSEIDFFQSVGEFDKLSS